MRVIQMKSNIVKYPLQLTGVHYRIGQSLVICHVFALSIRKKTCTHMYRTFVG